MSDIPRENHGLAHLNKVRRITGIDDWFSFLDLKDRLVYLMQISRRLGAGIGEEDGNPFVTSCDCSFQGLLDWYGRWADKTSCEDWLFRQIAKRNYEWWEVSSYFDSESERALAVIARFRRLIDLAEEADL